MSGPVIQNWVCELPFMQQSVLLAAIRGPDGLPKDHVSKLLLRWLRRCILLSAFDRCALVIPYDPEAPRGGSFTGPSIAPVVGDDWRPAMDAVVTEYLRRVDEAPHHFHLHFMHATEILGFKFPTQRTRSWWEGVYRRLVNDAHLQPETREQFERRLGDNEIDWRAAEEVTASRPAPDAGEQR